MVSLLIATSGMLITIVGALPVALNGFPSLLASAGFFFGLSLLLVAGLVWASSRVYDFVIGFVTETTHVICNCEDHDVDSVYHFASSFFGETITSQNQIRLILRKYKGGLKLAKKRTKAGYSLVGYIFYFPINKEIVDKIHKYKFSVGELTPKDIATQAKYGYAMYVGAIAGKGLIAKAQMLSLLMNYEQEAMKTKTKTIYARAASSDGLKLLKKNGFEPVHARADDIDCFFRKVVY